MEEEEEAKFRESSRWDVVWRLNRNLLTPHAGRTAGRFQVDGTSKCSIWLSFLSAGVSGTDALSLSRVHCV